MIRMCLNLLSDALFVVTAFWVALHMCLIAVYGQVMITEASVWWRNIESVLTIAVLVLAIWRMVWRFKD